MGRGRRGRRERGVGWVGREEIEGGGKREGDMHTFARSSQSASIAVCENVLSMLDERGTVFGHRVTHVNFFLHDVIRNFGQPTKTS
jgi:hypothetical protein